MKAIPVTGQVVLRSDYSKQGLRWMVGFHSPEVAAKSPISAPHLMAPPHELHHHSSPMQIGWAPPDERQ